MDIAVDEYEAPKSHSRLKKMVDQYLELTRESADEARKDRDYYDGDQISDAMRSELEKRGQPIVFTNKLAPAINGMLGLIDSNNTAVEAYPRNYKDRDAADVATKVLRYLADSSRFNVVKQRCSENFFIEGACAAIVEWDGQKLDVNRILWEDLIYDPLSREHDFSDAKYLGIGKLMDRADVQEMFETFSGSGGQQDQFDFFDDKSKRQRYWGLEDREAVRVVDLYYESAGRWHRAIMTGTEVLYSGPSEYKDELGRSACPILATSYEVKRGGDRYGPIRNMRPLQDEINARRSKLLAHLNNRQVRNTEMTGMANKETAKREAARPDGALPFGWESVATTDMAQGQMTVLQQSTADIDRMAPSPAVLGRAGGANTSGRAHMVLQQAGMTELARQFARFEDFELSIYRMLWTSARTFLKEPTWIRITDDPRSVEFLQINEPVMGTVARPLTDPATGEPMIDPQTGAPALEMGQAQVGTNNPIAELDMDIILSTVPNPITLELEVFQMVMDWAGSTKQSPLSPEFAIMLELSPLPNKREALERIKAVGKSMAGDGPDPAQEAAMQMGMEGQKATISRDLAKAAKDSANAEQTKFQMMRQGLGLAD